MSCAKVFFTISSIKTIASTNLVFQHFAYTTCNCFSPERGVMETKLACEELWM